ncbi:unnamed protein product [Prunus armeniaca]|uniref:Uncharacterized protein n=1 Tax=Prunus armeniaca TaxID=36596 RepID=A0A6J5VRK8_PRUAR|nr:unnamed protein product [Prunus armeniaca]
MWRAQSTGCLAAYHRVQEWEYHFCYLPFDLFRNWNSSPFIASCICHSWMELVLLVLRVYAPKIYHTSLIRNETETKTKEKKKKRFLEGPRAWGIICLSLAFTWQLYTTWLLVHLHESESGIRYSRYLHLAVTAFGLKLGKLLTIFPVMYQSGGTCVQLIIIGGGIMELFFKNVCDVKSLKKL